MPCVASGELNIMFVTGRTARRVSRSVARSTTETSCEKVLNVASRESSGATRRSSGWFPTSMTEIAPVIVSIRATSSFSGFATKTM